jgi:hypothetical protein
MSGLDPSHGHRDATMILMAYRHGFRVSELVDLRGTRSTSTPPTWLFGGSRAAHQARIRSAATNCAHCAGWSANRSLGIRLRLHVGAGFAIHDGGLCSACGALWCGCQAGVQGSPPHAAARLRLRLSQ